ncbi:ABC transporter substrate-binding protein [Gordonia sp. NB41Y]|uniref:ABC transporter substrate-binding protein n=1 Tax=Gordonia sp. NB41Y TaxID=875808 RepID=UPI0006B172CF|nr:ABC transporter substrate-binding protein [Gordonia sp. NB41Y]EMP11747.2 ABC transporter substrate-binding protein [Gordonia sp. NB41Y]WLP90063.1 ABC transporter substrate-binding protein [Gordonia sp. NB41Y]
MQDGGEKQGATGMRRGGRTGRGRAVLVTAGAACAVALALSGCSDEQTALTTPDGKTISTSTTRVAEVNIVSADRDYARTCLAPTAVDDARADAARIVVTDPALLDDLCALGLGPRVTAVTAAPGSIPAYLGPQLTAVPTIGTSPDAAAVRSAAPDLVLTTAQTAGSAGAFTGTRSVTIPAGDWRSRFQSVADAVGRSDEARRLLGEFDTEATKTGRRMDAAHTQVSLVRFTADAEKIAGTGSFAGQILAQVGVQRPASQRGAEGFTVTDADFTDADADLIYVSFEGEGGLEHGKQVLLSDRWLDMGAPTWKRVLSVDDEVWYGGDGLAAAWLVLNDIKGSLNGNS